MSPWKVLAPWLLAMAMTSVASADYVRCEVDGRTVYQRGPCMQGQEQQTDGRVSSFTAPELAPRPEVQSPAPPTLTPMPGVSDTTSQPSRYEQELEDRRREVRARSRGVVLSGMSESQATSILGRPDTTENYSTDGRLCKRMYWRERRGSRIEHYVRVCDGEVIYYSGGR